MDSYVTATQKNTRAPVAHGTWAPGAQGPRDPGSLAPGSQGPWALGPDINAEEAPSHH